MKRSVLIVGNSIEKSDRMPVVLMPLLIREFPTIAFFLYDPTEELPEAVGDDLVLIDSVVGIGRVTVFEGLDEFLVSPRVSVHDYDLPVHLTLLLKLGKIKSVKIIGVPAKGKREKVLKELRRVIPEIYKVVLY